VGHHQQVLFGELVATSVDVAATRARSVKIRRLADFLSGLAPDEIEASVSWLAGEPRQGKIGIGWATVYGLDVTPAAEATLSITDLDTAIEAVKGLTGPGSVAARQAVLTGLLVRATAPEADFIRRLLVGELRQGALEGVMTEAVAAAARLPVDAVRRAIMLAGDLPGVATTALVEGVAGLEDVGLELLRPIQPMLASTAAGVEEAIKALGVCSVEWKFDGARVQAHRLGDEVRLFTRNLNDITGRLPAVEAVVAALPVSDIVLDGEVLGMGDGERPGMFQDTMSRFSRQDGTAGHLGVWFFDCLHLNGEDLIDRPLADRLDALQRAAGPWRVPNIVTDDAQAASAFLESALAAGHEGVMVKAVGSPYEAGRRGQAWRKVKPVRTLDLVVLAAEWGHGRRRGWLSNLHLGARNEAGGWVMVGKTFKGLTDAMLTWQTAALLESETDREGITVRVRPELVVEVALDGVQSSSRYAGGVALRFARVRRYRDDKSPAEADTIETVRALLPIGASPRLVNLDASPPEGGEELDLP
jgi:DNA ligase-1